MSMPEEARCPHCGGSGWVVVERDGISGARRCECATATRNGHLLDRSAIPLLYQSASFDNFSLPQDNPQGRHALSQVVTRVMSYAREYPALDKPGLLLIGDPGTGKTHLAVAALRRLLGKGHEGVFFDYQNLLERIRSSYDANSGTTDREAYRTVLDTEVVLLDDLGAHRVTDWVEDTITSIITHRCNNRKALIATTNLREDQTPQGTAGELMKKHYLAERIGMRARSRLFEMCHIIRMPQIEDYRVRMARP
jgi:DNA replication protein DnaC